MKKAICFLLMILMLTVMLPTAVLAEGETPEPTVEPETQLEGETPEPTVEPTTQPEDDEPAATTEFEIDNEHVYAGMEQAFKDGYNPTIKNGKVIIVLPLIVDGEIKDNIITATPGLGGASAPFVYSNYQKDITLADNEVEGGGTISSYLVRFDLPLTKLRYNGVYPVSIDVTAASAEGVPVQGSFTVYVTIKDGKDPNAPEPTPKPEVPKSQPKVIVSGYEIDPSVVMAGEEFTADITLENTSEDQSVQNMSVTIVSDSQNFVLLDDSNVIFIDEMEEGEKHRIKVRYKTDLETPAQRYYLALSIEYDNSDAVTLVSSGTVMVEVSQTMRVELEPPQAPESVNAGDTIPLDFQVMNMGRSGAYNVRIELDVPGLIPSETAFIGNMEPGSAMPAQMNVFVGTKIMSEGYQGEDKYGYTSGKIRLIFEDSAGQEFVQETDFTTTINPPVINSQPEQPEEQEETAGQWWISLIIGAGIIAAVTAFLVIKNRRGKQHNEDF